MAGLVFGAQNRSYCGMNFESSIFISFPAFKLGYCQCRKTHFTQVGINKKNQSRNPSYERILITYPKFR